MSKLRGQSGSAVLPILMLLIIAAGIGMWFYLQKDLNDMPPPQAEVTTQTLPPAETADASAPATNEAVPAAPEETADGAIATADAAFDLDRAVGVRAVGNPDAPVKVVEYASLTCSHCAHFHNDVFPALKEKYIDTGKVYFEFREFPLNDPALKATITARCLPPERYEGFISLLFQTQNKWAGGIDYMAHLKQNAKLAGLSDEQFDACQKSPELKLKIAEKMQEAQDKWKVSSTPTFIINDGAQTISGAQPLENFERAFRAVSDGAVGDAPQVE